MRVGLGLEVPISLAAKVEWPLVGSHDAGDVIVAACLQQQHADVGVFGQTTRNDRSGRTRSADDEVILRLEIITQLALIEANTFGKIGLREIRKVIHMTSPFVI